MPTTGVGALSTVTDPLHAGVVFAVTIAAFALVAPAFRRRASRRSTEERSYDGRAVEERSVKVSFITPDVPPVGWRARRRARRGLAEQDRLGARLAELTRIRDLAAAAGQVVAAGWVKDAWYVRPDARRVDLAQARRMGHVPVDRACLVGAILHAGGGVASADTQLVQRTLDLTWHTLHRGAAEPVRWCPAPPIRAQHLRDLVRWNDREHRTRADVEALLQSVGRAATRELDAHRRLLATRE